MDPFTVALAVFGVQKLRGKSTSRSFRDALLAAGGVQLAGMGGVPGFEAFGTEAMKQQGIAGFGKAATAGGAGKYVAAAPTTAAGGILEGTQIGGTLAGKGISALIGTAPVTDPVTGNITKAGTGYQGLGAGEKFGLGIAATSLFNKEKDPEDLGPSEADYKKAYENQPDLNFASGEPVQLPQPQDIYTYPNPLYYNKGGIVSVLPKYAQGGINYLPSKVTHDENDVHNYVRATGYVEDGSGTGDKDEDTILAQLADGEFVSRADAVLGAGIMAGASPGNMKDMRTKGASYFYEQQARFKRVFDLLNASRQTN
jgi:hypothetical protein